MPVSVVMPAYNEELVIAKMLDQLITLKEIDEIVVVDDGSSDNTVDIVQSYIEKGVRLIQHPYNIGNGAAVKTGVRNASGDIIVLMDSDGQHPPEEISKMLAYLDKYEMVVGARSHGTTSVWYRDIANRVFNFYASYLVGYPIPDLTSGFRVIRRDKILNFLYLFPNGFSYPTTITISMFRAGFPVKYHPFSSPARVGKSKIKIIRDGFRFLLILTRLGVFFVPLKFFLPISLLFVSVGFSYTVLRLITVNHFSGFGGLVTTVGILIFLLGLIAEQISMIRYMNSR